jgi:hypothetical protein
MLVIIILAVVVWFVVCGLICACLRRRLRDRRQLALVASELHTKARMDVLTRTTIQAMRAAAREH